MRDFPWTLTVFHEQKHSKKAFTRWTKNNTNAIQIATAHRPQKNSQEPIPMRKKNKQFGSMHKWKTSCFRSQQRKVSNLLWYCVFREQRELVWTQMQRNLSSNHVKLLNRGGKLFLFLSDVSQRENNFLQMHWKLNFTSTQKKNQCSGISSHIRQSHLQR